jgi:hypothetical protein
MTSRGLAEDRREDHVPEIRDRSDEVYVAAVRAQSFEQKLRASEALRALAWQRVAGSIRGAHPQWSDADVQQQVREVFLRGCA